jgi:hypothetical protein
MLAADERDALRQLAISDRLRVAADLLDLLDEPPTIQSRALRLVRVVEILTDVIAQLAPEIMRANGINR